MALRLLAWACASTMSCRVQGQTHPTLDQWQSLHTPHRLLTPRAAAVAVKRGRLFDRVDRELYRGIYMAIQLLPIFPSSEAAQPIGQGLLVHRQGSQKLRACVLREQSRALVHQQALSVALFRAQPLA